MKPKYLFDLEKTEYTVHPVDKTPFRQSAYHFAKRNGCKCSVRLVREVGFECTFHVEWLR